MLDMGAHHRSPAIGAPGLFRHRPAVGLLAADVAGPCPGRC
jgi:hypothetical protein